MAAKDDTSKDQTTRNQSTQDVPAETSLRVSAETSLQQAIEAERARLLQVSCVLHCLYEVLLYAEGDDVVTYVDAVHIAAILIDESVERLDSVRLRPMIKHKSHSQDRDYPLAQEKLGSSSCNRPVAATARIDSSGTGSPGPYSHPCLCTHRRRTVSRPATDCWRC
jgi:hypothetical protein